MEADQRLIRRAETDRKRPSFTNRRISLEKMMAIGSAQTKTATELTFTIEECAFSGKEIELYVCIYIYT